MRRLDTRKLKQCASPGQPRGPAPVDRREGAGRAVSGAGPGSGRPVRGGTSVGWPVRGGAGVGAGGDGPASFCPLGPVAGPPGRRRGSAGGRQQPGTSFGEKARRAGLRLEGLTALPGASARPSTPVSGLLRRLSGLAAASSEAAGRWAGCRGGRSGPGPRGSGVAATCARRPGGGRPPAPSSGRSCRAEPSGHRQRRPRHEAQLLPATEGL